MSGTCQLCLNPNDGNFTKFDASGIDKVKSVIPELTLSVSPGSLICSNCSTTLQKSFDLKSESSKTDDLIQSERERSKSETVNLSKFIEGGSQSGTDICRICLKTDDEQYFNIEEDDDFRSMLNYCMPELDTILTPKPAVCSSCNGTLCELYGFKEHCLSVDREMQSSDIPEQVDESKVNIIIEKTEEDFLSGFEVKDEDGNDIFNDAPYSGQSRKRPASISELEGAEAKRQKFLSGEIISEDLPDFTFDPSLLYGYNIKIATNISVEDWLEKVEQYRRKFGWSDSTTIHKVLVKLKPIKELHIWFSNIADIMDWQTWRKKLLHAFPKKDDYNVQLKKMTFRKKKKDESYMSYYADKITLLEPLNLTPEQKVSCLLGGVTDVLVCCVGRVGQYKTPQEVVEYFKSCDDKQNIEIENQNDANPGNAAKTVKTPNGNAAAAKRKRKKCYICHRTGHTGAECRTVEIGARLHQKMDRMPVTRNPRLNQTRARPLARPPAQKGKPPAKCTYCKKVGHVDIACPKKRRDATAPNIPPPNPKPAPQKFTGSTFRR
ncbi:hypothetical protein NQ315_003011 [Exocentrus adspersus]|uniref:CCHC-type domain-containing protein n=1 Tax=Exocentrus adspersus TaxID=1586481 RepID=A0AAV8W5W8_9CUCU|nr:hypothetical protein NQ315_003011 [Exocentrus adspersus]